MTELPNDPATAVPSTKPGQKLPNASIEPNAKTRPRATYDGYTVSFPGEDGQMEDRGSLAHGGNVNSLVRATAFLYIADYGRISVRLERKRRGSEAGYWVAYKRINGRLRKTYICEACALDAWNLDDAANRLLADDHSRPNIAE